MASHVVVIDSTFRRANIKVNPGTYLNDVLEEACKKLNLKSSNYGIKNNNKTVDLSRTFRQSGLSSGAKLELVVASRSPSVVSVALQLPESDAKAVPGGRMMDKFPSTTTLWLILRKFESHQGANLNFTGRGVAQTEAGSSGAGRIVYETPVLNIVGRDLSSFSDLQKTLAQLGLNSGSGLLRLSFRKTDMPLEEAMAEIAGYFKDGETEAERSTVSADITKAETEPKNENGPFSDEAPKTELSTAMEVDSTEPASTKIPASIGEESSPEGTVVGPGQRPISIFAAPSGSTPKAALQEINESDYEPTIAHAKLHQQRLLSRSQNVRLLSDAEEEALAKERAAKLSTVKDISIKVRFPDQLTIVSPFNSSDSGASLYDFVRDTIVAEDQPFKLVWMSPKGPQTVPQDEKVKLIKDLGFSGRMLVNFNWADDASEKARNGNVLKDKYAGQATEIKIQEIAAADAREGDYPVKAAETDKGKQKEGGKAKGGVPKWLKLPGKK